MAGSKDHGDGPWAGTQAGKKIPRVTASALIADAQRIQSVLAC